MRGAEFCDNLISGCIFLRLICPALLSPSLFGLVSAFPSDPWCQRNLTLLAKSLQSLANFTAFDDKVSFHEPEKLIDLHDWLSLIDDSV